MFQYWFTNSQSFFFSDIRNRHLGPYRSLILKKMAPKTFHYWKGLVILHIFCSICLHILFNRKKLWIKTCENFVVLKFCALASYNGLHHWCIDISFCLKITLTSFCLKSLHFVVYQSWKFHVGIMNSFWEVSCTPLVNLFFDKSIPNTTSSKFILKKNIISKPFKIIFENISRNCMDGF